MLQTKRKRRRTWPQPVLDRAIVLLRDRERNLSPRRVEKMLREEFRDGDEDGKDIPTWRTLYDIRADVQPGPDEQGRWSLFDADPEDARLVLPVIRELNRTGAGFLGWSLPKDVARWVATVRAADPDIPLVESFYQAMRYLQAEAGISDPDEADRWMVMQLWRDRPTRRTAPSASAVRPAPPPAKAGGPHKVKYDRHGRPRAGDTT